MLQVGKPVQLGLNKSSRVQCCWIWAWCPMLLHPVARSGARIASNVMMVLRSKLLFPQPMRHVRMPTPSSITGRTSFRRGRPKLERPRLAGEHPFPRACTIGLRYVNRPGNLERLQRGEASGQHHRIHGRQVFTTPSGAVLPGGPRLRRGELVPTMERS